MYEERIDELEIRMTHLENYFDQLNEIVLENGHILKTLKKEQLTLRQQINEVTEQLPGPGIEKPPHY